MLFVEYYSNGCTPCKLLETFIQTELIQCDGGKSPIQFKQICVNDMSPEDIELAKISTTPVLKIYSGQFINEKDLLDVLVGYNAKTKETVKRVVNICKN